MDRAITTTFAAQRTLPRLPIPPVADTLALYLKTVRPFGTDAAFAKTEAAVKKFVDSGAAHELQQRLVVHDKTQPGSWLSTWWLALAYH
ncbi:hypothetical protein HDU98_001195, partial [Podochytrium sp. JEL0797]